MGQTCQSRCRKYSNSNREQEVMIYSNKPNEEYLVESKQDAEEVVQNLKSHSISPQKPFGISQQPQCRVETQEEDTLDVHSSQNNIQAQQIVTPMRKSSKPAIQDHSTTYNAFQFEQLQQLLKSRPKQFDYLIQEQQRDMINTQIGVKQLLKTKKVLSISEDQLQQFGSYKLITSNRNQRNQEYQARRVSGTSSQSPRKKSRAQSPTKSSPTKMSPKKSVHYPDSLNKQPLFNDHLDLGSLSQYSSLRDRQYEHGAMMVKRSQDNDLYSPARRTPRGNSSPNIAGILKHRSSIKQNTSILSEKESGNGSIRSKKVRFKEPRRK